MPAFLAGSCQVQPVLEQPPQQLPAPRIQLFLQLTVLQSRRILRRHPVLKILIALPGLRERPVLPWRVPLHRAPSFPFWS